jgi:putative hydrolase of the HAD superfamily
LNYGTHRPSGHGFGELRFLLENPSGLGRLLAIGVERLPCPSVAKLIWALARNFFGVERLAGMIKAIFFDALGTLFYLTRTVGHHYALAGADVGLTLDPHQLDDAFYSAWKKMPHRAAVAGPRENDDKGWWRELVDLVLDQVAPSLNEFDRDNFFEIAYEHFAETGVWELYPEVPSVLEQLQPRFQLAVISNFDGRLRFILEHLGISKFFAHIFISSEIGADKPDPEIFRRALKLVELKPDEVLHVGDDPERDWEAASAAGLSTFRLDRPKNSLRDLVTALKL